MITRQSRQRALRNQIRRLDRRIASLRMRDRQFSRLRLGLFIAGLAAVSVTLMLAGEQMAWLVFAAGGALFFGVVLLHRRVIDGLARHEIWRQLKQTQLARMQRDWEHLPPPALEQADFSGHAFAEDLDVIGDRSLHRLLDTTVTVEGSRRLRDWLLREIPDPRITRRRQQTVRELAPLSRFRHKLLLAFSLAARERLQGRIFTDWLGTTAKTRQLLWLVIGLALLAATNITLFFLHYTGKLPPYWIPGLALYAVIFLLNTHHVEHLMHHAVILDDEMQKLRAVLRFLEKYPYQRHARLAELCAPFWQDRPRPLQRLQEVKRISLLAGLRGNPLLALILNVLSPWDYFCALRLARCKQKLHLVLPRWLDRFYELEALSALANFAYLHPEYCFPAFHRMEVAAPSPMLSARAIGHPLIVDESNVRNDFEFADTARIALITGSNMSGKSTFLKTLGSNLCLAYAGAPVCAASLHTGFFRIFTCMKVNDSVTDGFSLFFAEVQRLKRLMEKLKDGSELPVLFLIDEIFKGTNNRERLIGSRCYIREAAQLPGLGAISTHDLELVALADEIETLRNYHFREEVQNGTMVFDYKLRPGPCPTTNALKIMRMQGLPVEELP